MLVSIMVVSVILVFVVVSIFCIVIWGSRLTVVSTKKFVSVSVIVFVLSMRIVDGLISVSVGAGSLFIVWIFRFFSSVVVFIFWMVRVC